jgi:lactate permease
VGNGLKALKGVFLITLISGLSFALPVCALAYFAGPELPTLIGSVCTIVCTVLASKRLYKDGGDNTEYQLTGISAAGDGYTMKQMLRACFPFILLFVLVLSTTMIPALHDLLARAGVKTAIYGGEGAVPLTFNWILTPGVLIFITILITCALQRGGFLRLLPEIGRVAASSKNIFITVISIISMAKVMSYSGMTDEIAVWLVAALGAFYPLVAPAIGMIGTFITGSDTTCCVLFGGLQANAAASVGANQIWVTASNLSGAAIGKMISPQSIAIGLGVGGLDGKEGILLKNAVRYGLILLAIVCAVTFAYAGG